MALAQQLWERSRDIVVAGALVLIALTLFVGLQGALQLRKLEGRAPAWVQADAVFDATLHALLRGFGARTETLRDVLALGR